MGHMDTYMVHVPLHVFWLILHGTLPKCYWGLLSLIMLIRRSTGCFKWYFWIFEHLSKCTNGHCQCLWCFDVLQSGLCTHNTFTISHLFDILTSFLTQTTSARYRAIFVHLGWCFRLEFWVFSKVFIIVAKRHKYIFWYIIWSIMWCDIGSLYV